jgi:hypothetical protein
MQEDTISLCVTLRDISALIRHNPQVLLEPSAALAMALKKVKAILSGSMDTSVATRPKTGRAMDYTSHEEGVRLILHEGEKM